jgi:hypothetical protein
MSSSAGVRRLNREEVAQGMKIQLEVLPGDHGNSLFAVEIISTNTGKILVNTFYMRILKTWFKFYLTLTSFLAICWYTNSEGDDVVELEESQRMYAVACDYTGTCFIDGSPNPEFPNQGSFNSGFNKVGGYANSPIGTRNKPNCRLMDITSIMTKSKSNINKRWLILISTSQINENTEILLDYGKNYKML